MKILANSWGGDNVASSIKYFAESVLELTNYYSAPGYQHRTMATTHKADELSSAVGDVFHKIVKKPYLAPMIAEYTKAIDSDPIIIHMTERYGISNDALKFRIEDPLEKIASRLKLFIDLFAISYAEGAVELLTSLCLSEKREKEKIRKCADNYITHLVASGFSRDYLHISAKKAFSTIDVAGFERERLELFFEYTKEKLSTYEILLILPSDSADVLQATFNAKVVSSRDELPIYFQKSISELSVPIEDSTYVILDTFPGKDAFAAVRNTVPVQNLAHAFHLIFPNKASVMLPKHGYAYESSTGAVYRAELMRFVAQGRVIRNGAAHSELRSRMARFAFDNRRMADGSGHKIFSALSSAAIAARSVDYETRLTSIWSAFEALLPHPSKDGESTVRINHFVENIAPLVTVKYTSDVYRNHYQNLQKNYRGKFYKYIDRRGVGNNRFEKFLSIFFSDVKVKRELTELTADSDLLMHRSYELDRLANDAKLLKAKIEAHEERVRWQLHRIYRARNLIVHSGSGTATVPQLTENGFSYFKSLMEVLVDAGEKFGISNSDALFDLCVSVCQIRRDNLEKMASQNSREFLSSAVSKLF